MMDPMTDMDREARAERVVDALDGLTDLVDGMEMGNNLPPEKISPLLHLIHEEARRVLPPKTKPYADNDGGAE